MELIGYSDASWGNTPEERRSVSGFAFKYGPCLLTWKSSRQKSIALSTAEAEYMALSDAAREAIYMRWLLNSILGIGDRDELDSQPPVKIFEDNQAAIRMAINPTSHDRSKHIDIRYNYVRDKVLAGKLDIVYIPTKEQAADIFTKTLNPVMFKEARNLLGMTNRIELRGVLDLGDLGIK